MAFSTNGQAQKTARAWWRTELRREEGHDTRSGPYTVAGAMKVVDIMKTSPRTLVKPWPWPNKILAARPEGYVNKHVLTEARL